MKYCRHLKYIKNIVLVTDGKGRVDWGGVEDVAQQINTQNIKLSVLYNSNLFLNSYNRGIDFDDADYGFKEEDKAKEKA